MLKLLRDMGLVLSKVPIETLGPHQDVLSEAFGRDQMSADQ